MSFFNSALIISLILGPFTASAKSIVPAQEEICANQATQAIVALNTINRGKERSLVNLGITKDLKNKTFSATAVNFDTYLAYKASSFLAGDVCTVTEVIVSDID